VKPNSYFCATEAEENNVSFCLYRAYIMRVAIQWTIAGILLCSPISAAKSVPDKIRALSAKNYFEVVKASLSTKYSAETIQGIRKSLEEERQHEIDRLDSDHDRLKDEEETEQHGLSRYERDGTETRGSSLPDSPGRRRNASNRSGPVVNRSRCFRQPDRQA
jgi:hypothetical protein